MDIQGIISFRLLAWAAGCWCRCFLDSGLRRSSTEKKITKYAHGASRCFSVCGLSLCVCICLVDVVFCCVFAIVLMVVGMNACSFFGDD